MELSKSITSLSALAQQTRLEVFRLLVRQAPDGLAAGDIATSLDVLPNTLSAQLTVLRQAGLLLAERRGRSIWYRVNFDAVQQLLTWLMRDCCQGDPASIETAVKQCCGETKS